MINTSLPLTCIGGGVDVSSVAGPQTDSPVYPLSGRVKVGDSRACQIVSWVQISTVGVLLIDLCERGR